ncbi:hypothetical protein SAMN04487867_104116 [Vreelandella titanicae]|uniref:hypothetical protein n=1 Tax=Vreelandella titanicae TaxID=664683 RepID=UPI00088F5BDC|nr:hypothetical protein [Halomonas titanicae]SDI28957.1 hypothetical protein SAMN04487867_104116 [Halomonas titanicae]
MGIELKLSCDALDCLNEHTTEIDDHDDLGRLVTSAGWIADPSNPDFVYCRKCKPIVKAEWAEEEKQEETKGE